MAECDCAPAKDVVIEETIERLRFITAPEAAEVLTDTWFWDQEGPGFTCREAEAIGALMMHAGIAVEVIADLIVTGHGQPGRSEDFGDDHWHEPEPCGTGYMQAQATIQVVPVVGVPDYPGDDEPRLTGHPPNPETEDL